MRHISLKLPDSTSPHEQGYWNEKYKKEFTKRYKEVTENIKVGDRFYGKAHR
jgi:hypothetical protein